METSSEIQEQCENMKSLLGHFLSKERTCAKNLLQAKAFTEKRFAERDKKEVVRKDEKKNGSRREIE
jgi:hypothetical protein